MKARVDASTDVAMIGAWDAQRSAKPLSASELQQSADTLEVDAAAGHLFLLHTGADIGGPIDLYIDEPIPVEIWERLASSGEEFLLALPSGALVVGGAEYYRSAEPNDAGSKSVVSVPAGDYSVRVYSPKDTEESPGSEEQLRRMVGSADLQYYDRVNHMGCLVGSLTLLLFPILSFPLGWKIALVVTAVVFLSFFPVRQRLLERNARYQRLDKLVPAFRLQHEDAMLVLELRSISDRGTVKGGSASL